MSWEHYVDQPFRAFRQGIAQASSCCRSPYRFIIDPIVQFILDLSEKNAGRSIIVVDPGAGRRQMV